MSYPRQEALSRFLSANVRPALPLSMSARSLPCCLQDDLGSIAMLQVDGALLEMDASYLRDLGGGSGKWEDRPGIS